MIFEEENRVIDFTRTTIILWIDIFWVILGTGEDVMWLNWFDVYFEKRKHIGVRWIKLLFSYFKRLNRKYLYFKRRIIE